jgi:hypothetical protein
MTEYYNSESSSVDFCEDCRGMNHPCGFHSRQAIKIIETILPLLHRTVKRYAPGFRDDGIITSWQYKMCDELAEDEKCLGCEAESLLKIIKA